MPFRPPDPFDDLCTVAIDLEPVDAGAPPKADWSALPTEAGVVIFVDANDKPVLIRGIGDPRAFVQRRFSPEPANDPSPRVDYRAVVRHVCVIPAGHTSLAELLAVACEATIDPDAARSSSARLGACFVLADGSARLPMFRTAEWRDLWDGSDRIRKHETVLGPFANAKRAKRWAEHIVDLFDLCRYDHLLAQTPDATACVYKQMGKCPAPCDGTEPLESYRERFRRALAFTGDAVARDRETTIKRMERASADLDFESAAALKDRLDALDALSGGGPWEVRDLRETQWEIKGPTRKPGWLRRSAVSLDGLRISCDAIAGSADSSGPPLRLGTSSPWLLLAHLADCLQRGLASGESVEQRVREPAFGSE